MVGVSKAQCTAGSGFVAPYKLVPDDCVVSIVAAVIRHKAGSV